MPKASQLLPQTRPDASAAYEVNQMAIGVLSESAGSLGPLPAPAPRGLMHGADLLQFTSHVLKFP